MKYVEFYDTRPGRVKYLGEVRLDGGKLVISGRLAPRWPRINAYRLLGRYGYSTMYDPERILDSLPGEFTEDHFKASPVKHR